MNADFRSSGTRDVSTARELRSLLPPLAAVILLLGGGYLSYARARVEAAIATAAERAGWTVRYRAVSSWRPGHVRLRDLVIASGSSDWSLRLERIDIVLVPVLGGPRLIRLEVPDQRMQLRTESYQWRSRLRAGADLAGLTTLGAHSVRHAVFGLREGTLHSQTYALRAVTAKVTLTGAREPRSEALLHGELSLRGGSGAEMLTVLGAEVAARRFSPDALRQPFEMHSRISVDRARVKLDPVAITCGEVSLEGGLELRSAGTSGALRMKSAAPELDEEIGERDLGGAWF